MKTGNDYAFSIRKTAMIYLHTYYICNIYNLQVQNASQIVINREKWICFKKQYKISRFIFLTLHIEMYEFEYL